MGLHASDPHTSPAVRRRTKVGATVAAVVAGIVTLTLATYGSYSVIFGAFGVRLECSTVYRCTEVGCPPCSAANTWLAAGWVIQGILALASLIVLVRGTRTWHARTVFGTTVLLVVLSFSAITGTTWLAEHSFPNHKLTRSSLATTDALTTLTSAE